MIINTTILKVYCLKQFGNGYQFNYELVLIIELNTHDDSLV